LAILSELGVIGIEGESVLVIWVCIEVEAQFIDGEAEGHKFTEGGIGTIHFTFDGFKEGQIKAGEQGTGGEGLVLSVSVVGIDLHRDIREREAGA